MTKYSPEIIEVNLQEIEAILDRATGKINDDDLHLLRRIVESYSYVSDLVEDKNTSIARLRKLFFGAKSEKTKDIVGDSEDSLDADTPGRNDLPEEPADGGGDVEIIMESSTDMVTWTEALPGTYGTDTAKRFFRLRAVRVTGE